MDNVGEWVRVLYFTQGYTPHDQRFLSTLAGTGHAIHYMSLKNTGTERARNELPASVHIEDPLQGSRKPHWLQYPILARKLRNQVNRISPDLIHAGPIHMCSMLSALADLHPLVSMSWGSDLLWEARKPWVASAVRYALAKSDAFVGDCQAVRAAAIRNGMEERRIIIFPWGVDLAHFSPGSGRELRSRLGWEDGFILISTRSFERVYGVDLIVKAFIQVARESPDLRLLMLGSGSQRAIFERWLKRAGLMERAYFAGVVDHRSLPRYYRAADVYISASHSDGSSVSLMEALSCARPALVSNIPGNLEWISPEVNGWIFRDGDLISLVNTLRQVMDSRSEIEVMGKAARQLAETKADWKNNFPRLLEAYELAVGAVVKSNQ